MLGSLTELSPPSLAGELLPCITCNRTFLPEALARHQNICQKTAHKKRKVFSSSRQRLQGTGIDPEEVRRSPSPPPRRRSASRSSWRDKHTQLLNTVRSARGAATPGQPAVPADYEQCPFCARHFGPKAAERHISWCKEQKSRINSSSASAAAKNRLDARVKYQAPLPLKPRPKRLSVERISREASPAVSTVSAPAPAAVPTVRSPTRQTRDYAREYRERASQEREQRIQERKRSPAAVVSSGYGRQPASRLAREGSEPRATSPSKEAFRRTQSFRTRPAGTRATSLKHQRTAGTLSGRSSASLKHQPHHHHHHHQQRDEPDGGEDVPADRPGYRRSTSTPAEDGGGGFHSRLSPSHQGDPFSAGPDRSPSPPPSAREEAFITRSQLDEFQRISDAVKHRRLSAAAPAGTPPPPAEGDSPPPPPERGWSEPPWRPIDDAALSSNRSSVERNGNPLHPLQFPGLGGDERGMSPADSLYETEMPDFDLIMEQARRASERKHSAMSPRKARRRGLDMREMMGIEVSDMNMKNGGGGGGGSTSPRFCHECGSQYPVQAAKFCCQCGAQKLCI